MQRVKLGASLSGMEEVDGLDGPRVSHLQIVPPPAIVIAVRRCIQELSDRCDGARMLDGEGFNKNDSERGHGLASKEDWTMRDLEWAMEKVIFYRRQLPVEMVNRVKEYL